MLKILSQNKWLKVFVVIPPKKVHKKIALSFKVKYHNKHSTRSDFLCATNWLLLKIYNMNQLILPMDYSDLISENHVARAVNDMVNRLDDHLFYDVY